MYNQVKRAIINLGYLIDTTPMPEEALELYKKDLEILVEAANQYVPNIKKET